MKLNFITLCSACYVLLFGNVFADARESKAARQLSADKFDRDVKDVAFGEQGKKAKHKSLSWFDAAEAGDLESMKEAYDSRKTNFMIYEKDKSGKTALEIAVTNGHYDVVKWLSDRTDEQEEADKASNFNLRSSDETGKPLMVIAAEKGYEDIVKLMMLRLMSPDTYIDKSNFICRKTPLMAAAENGHIDVVDLLLTNKGDPRLLKIDHSKADPDKQDRNGRTALMYAIKNGHEDIVRLLLDNKADPNKKDEWGDTALISSAFNDQESIVKLLLEYGADPDIKNKDKETALICAVKRGHYNIAKMLLENGAKINIKDKEKKTALDYAQENSKMTKLLTDYVDRPENQKVDKNVFKKAWNKVTKKNDDKKGLSKKSLSADSEATLVGDRVRTRSGIYDRTSSSDTLAND